MASSEEGPILLGIGLAIVVIALAVGIIIGGVATFIIWKVIIPLF
jgi:hypothetical protein